MPFGLLVVASTVAGPLVKRLTWSHELAGYLLLGFVCTDSALDMVVHATAMDKLKWAMVICKAFIAFESATHLALAAEMKYYKKFVVLAAVSHVTLCFVISLIVLMAMLGKESYAAISGCDSSTWENAAVPAGSLLMAMAAAIGMITSATEPSTYVDIVTEARAQGHFVAAGAPPTPSGPRHTPKHGPPVPPIGAHPRQQSHSHTTDRASPPLPP